MARTPCRRHLILRVAGYGNYLLILDVVGKRG